MIDTQGIVDAVRVVAHFNPPMEELVQSFEAFLPDAPRVKDQVADAVRDGAGVFEGLAKTSPRLADCVHSFVYFVSDPFNSVTTKNRARDEVAKVILEL
jgi:hypothetical protein